MLLLALEASLTFFRLNNTGSEQFAGHGRLKGIVLNHAAPHLGPLLGLCVTAGCYDRRQLTLFSHLHSP